MMGWNGGWIGPWMWLSMAAFWVLLIGLGVVLVVKLLQSPSGSPHPPPVPESPLEVLDRRLALGEIDVQTYQDTRAALLAARRGHG